MVSWLVLNEARPLLIHVLVSVLKLVELSLVSYITAVTDCLLPKAFIEKSIVCLRFYLRIRMSKYDIKPQSNMTVTPSTYCFTLIHLRTSTHCSH